jgi:hypothetical protein
VTEAADTRSGVPVRFFSVKSVAQPTLYEVLSSPAPEGAVAGETIRTLAKETLDNDDEAMMLGLILDGETTDPADPEPTLYEVVAGSASTGFGQGETDITRKRETVDNDAEMLFAGMVLDA